MQTPTTSGVSGDALFGYAIAVVMAGFALAGWFRGSKEKDVVQARWQGEVNQLLKTMNDKLEKIDDLVGLPGKVEQLEKQLTECKNEQERLRETFTQHINHDQRREP